jgi:hypothetical protein
VAAGPADQRSLHRAGPCRGPGREERNDDGLDIAVTSSAVLVVGYWPAAIATERITRSFTQLLAD